VPILAVLLIMALVVTLAGVFPFRQILAQQRQVELTRAQHEALLAENARLEEELALLQTPQEVERIARERYGLVLPGEVGYMVVAPEGGELQAEAVAPPVVEEQRRWWERLWDFLTGRDLDPGG
jgi:cell division protein FtsB